MSTSLLTSPWLIRLYKFGLMGIIVPLVMFGLGSLLGAILHSIGNLYVFAGSWAILSGVYVAFIWRQLNKDDFSGWFTRALLAESLFIVFLSGISLILLKTGDAESLPGYIVLLVEGTAGLIVFYVSLALAVLAVIIKKYNFALVATYMMFATMSLHNLVSFVLDSVYILSSLRGH